MDTRSDPRRSEAEPGIENPNEKPLSPNEARQGFLGRPVLIILLAGLVLALLVWIPVEWWGNAIAPENPSNQPAPQEATPPAQTSPPQQ